MGRVSKLLVSSMERAGVEVQWAGGCPKMTRASPFPRLTVGWGPGVGGGTGTLSGASLLGRDKGPLWAGSPSDFCEEGRPRVIILPGSAVGSSALQAGSPSAAAPSSRWLRKHHRGTPAFVTRAVMSNAVGSSVEVYVLLRKREPVE